MTPEQRQQVETQIQNDFSELQKKLEELQNEVKNESDENKKQEKQAEYQKLLEELKLIEQDMKNIESRNEEEVLALKTKLEETKKVYQEYGGEVSEMLNEKTSMPTTYELLKDSETCIRLRNIISSNPNEFKDVPGDTAEAKLEYIFEKIRNGIVLFMKNKLGDSENIDKVINDTIAPAFEWSLMELLRDNGNETNVSMLQKMDTISFDSFNKLVKGVSKFAKKASGSYNKFSQWMNAVDYLSVHNGVLRNPNKSEVLSNPLKFQEYINDARFAAEGFSPYAVMSGNIFKVDNNQTFEFGISLQEKQQVLQQIGSIQVVNNPKTTSLIVKMLDKPEQFLSKTEGLQKTANGLLDGVSSLNSVTKIFGVDILGDITKAPEKRSFLYKILDFVCKLIGITGGLEGIVKKWRLDRMSLTDEKSENISQIFKEYKESAGENKSLSVTDENSCKTALSDFEVTDPKNQSTTKGDYLRDSIAKNVDASLISPEVVHEILGDSYLKKEEIEVKGEKQERVVVDASKITENEKLLLAHKHLQNMKVHLEQYVANDLQDFYKQIHSTEDLALCMTASMYADKDDVIEGVKAQVFLPENYGSVRLDGTSVDNQNSGRQNLDSAESSDKQVVSEQWIYDKAVEYGIIDKRQIAYILATVKGECSFKNQEEVGKGNGKDYGKVDQSTGHAYYGRGFIQLTWKGNYQKYTQIIQSSGKDFKDNDGNILKGKDIDLVNNPDIILKSNDLAAFILMDWMKNGGPDRLETKKISYYVNDTKADYYNARIIVNGMSSKPQEYADNALAYQNKIGNGSIDSSIESNDLLIGPKLLAHNKDEMGGLGDSIMKGFGLDFPNMDGDVGKNTRNHPHRFLSKNDVSSYKTMHPDIKSFMFYFGANNDNNQQTISDITKQSEWLQEAGIQPVLTTCIGENSAKTPRLKDLNQKMIALGKEKNRPVLDFAKSYNKGDIALGTDGVHPTSYSSMSNIINGQLSQA